jgi:phosphate transport system protein
MQSHFEKEISGLKDSLLTMASHAETSVRRAVDGLMTRDERLVSQVRENEDIIDRFEVEIDEVAVQLLSKAPLASDLRLIMVAMKISQNLERVGDEASKIAKRTRELIQDAPLRQVARIPRLADMVLEMLKASLDAFVTHNPAAARALIPRDKEVDALNKEIYRELANQMVENPETIARGLNLIVVAKSLERIGDHAKNVAEEVVYLFEAQDIRHTAGNKSATT